MTTYKILATRTTHYEFEIEADTQSEAIDEMQRIEIKENVEDYAYDWFPLEVEQIYEVEEF